MTAINKFNSFNIVFQAGIKGVLNAYQVQNLEKLKELKHILQIFIASEASNIYSMKMHLDNLSITIDTINPDIDQKMFIDSNFTGKHIEDEIFLMLPQVPYEKSMIDSTDLQKNDCLLKIITDC